MDQSAAVALGRAPGEPQSGRCYLRALRVAAFVLAAVVGYLLLVTNQADDATHVPHSLVVLICVGPYVLVILLARAERRRPFWWFSAALFVSPFLAFLVSLLLAIMPRVRPVTGPSVGANVAGTGSAVTLSPGPGMALGDLPTPAASPPAAPASMTRNDWLIVAGVLAVSAGVPSLCFGVAGRQKRLNLELSERLRPAIQQAISLVAQNPPSPRPTAGFRFGGTVVLWDTASGRLAPVRRPHIGIDASQQHMTILLCSPPQGSVVGRYVSPGQDYEHGSAAEALTTEVTVVDWPAGTVQGRATIHAAPPARRTRLNPAAEADVWAEIQRWIKDPAAYGGSRTGESGPPSAIAAPAPKITPE